MQRDELAATKQLVEVMAREPGAFDFAAYRDAYADKLRAVIDAKLAGKEAVSPAAGEVPAVANLMEAVQRSLASAKKSGPGRKPKKRKTS